MKLISHKKNAMDFASFETDILNYFSQYDNGYALISVSVSDQPIVSPDICSQLKIVTSHYSLKKKELFVLSLFSVPHYLF